MCVDSAQGGLSSVREFISLQDCIWQEVLHAVMISNGMREDEAALRMSAFSIEVSTLQDVQARVRQHGDSLRRKVEDETFWRDQVPLQLASDVTGDFDVSLRCRPFLPLRRCRFLNLSKFLQGIARHKTLLGRDSSLMTS